ncbi:hypothetical protein [Nocardia sp. NPDC051463]|uniref:hypothetical protein n=1 Tax=Nocardia sp. NPDC051463 TaxID=3154845 RepID=UPI00341E7FDD
MSASGARAIDDMLGEATVAGEPFQQRRHNVEGTARPTWDPLISAQSPLSDDPNDLVVEYLLRFEGNLGVEEPGAQWGSPGLRVAPRSVELPRREGDDSQTILGGVPRGSRDAGCVVIRCY